MCTHTFSCIILAQLFLKEKHVRTNKREREREYLNDSNTKVISKLQVTAIGWQSFLKWISRKGNI